MALDESIAYQKQLKREKFEPLLVSQGQKKFFKIIREIGGFILIISLIIFLISFGPVLKQELFFRAGLNTLEADTVIGKIDSDGSASVVKEASYWGVDPQFSIVIPKIDARAAIVANVDPGRSIVYLNALKKGVAHAQGTNFPGQGGSIYLFSHSTDSPLNIVKYNAVFYLLGKLEKHDEIIIFYESKKFTYLVESKVVVAANNTTYLNQKSSEERLILQTCDPPGTTWKRLLVIAKPVD